MMSAIKTKLMTYCFFLASKNPLDKYNWFKDILTNDAVKNGDYQSLLLEVAEIIYYGFYMIAVLFFGYKIIKGIYNYYTRAVHEIQKNQMSQEIIEPIVGLILFSVGLPIIKTLVKLILDITL